MATFAIIIERCETGSYGAWSPDLLGCVAAADDQDECLRLMQEAIEFHLEGMREDGDPMPQPCTVAVATFTTQPDVRHPSGTSPERKSV